MRTFHVVALAAPLFASFVTVAFLAWKREWKPATFAFGSIAAMLLIVGLVSGAGIGVAGPVVLFTAAFTAFAAGTHLLAGQVASGLVTVALYATLFAGGPFVDEAILKGDPAVIESRIGLLLAVNPYSVIECSIFGGDLLRTPGLYSSHFADYYSGSYPRWTGVAVGYAILGIVLAAIGLRRTPKAP